MTNLIQIAAMQREELTAARMEIQMLRAALQARQAATPDTPLTRAEIRLRAVEQIYAANGMARGYANLGNCIKAQQWRDIARDFERAAKVLTHSR